MMDLGQLTEGNVTVKIAGERVPVDSDDNVRDTLHSLLDARGISSFSVYVDGTEIRDSRDLPDTFGDHVIEVQKQVKAGLIW